MDLIVMDRIVDRKWIIAAAFWKTRQGCSAEVVPVARQLLVLSVVKVARGRSADAITGYLTGTVTSCRVAGGTPPGRCTSHAVSRHVVLGAGSVQAAESSAERRLPPGRAIHRVRGPRNASCQIQGRWPARIAAAASRNESWQP